MKISVIVPALNEEKYIQSTLESIKNQTYKNHEIIVSDGNSADKTVEIAKKYTNKITKSSKQRISVQRNKGAELANGDLLLFLDADTTIDKDFLQKMANKFQDPKIVAAAGYMRSHGKITHRLAVRACSEAVGILSKTKPHMCGSCLIMRKNIFEKIGGFDENLTTAEDLDISRKASKHGKCKLVRDAVAITSPRRLASQGTLKSVLFYVKNFFRYGFFKRGSVDFEEKR